MRALLIVALAALLAACATTPGRITRDFDPAQDFSAYRSFAWADESPMAVFGARMIPATIEPRIARSIRSALEAKGYTYVEDVAEADFAVSFTVGTRDGTEIIEKPDLFWDNRVNWRWGVGYFPVLPPRSMTMTRTEIREYTEGTLAIDLYDVERRMPVWHGAARRNLTSAQLRGETGDIDAAVQRILEGFPPEARP